MNKELHLMLAVTHLHNCMEFVDKEIGYQLVKKSTLRKRVLKDYEYQQMVKELKRKRYL